MFTFLLGQEEKPFTVHSAVISAWSKPLYCLMNDPMNEANEGGARLPDLTIEDFGRFYEFCARGDYTTPSFTEVHAPEDSQVCAGTLVQFSGVQAVRKNVDEEDYAWEFLDADHRASERLLRAHEPFHLESESIRDLPVEGILKFLFLFKTYM